MPRLGLLLEGAFVAAQLIATLLAVYANWGFAKIQGIGWGWAGVIWLYSIITYIPLDFIEFFIRYALSGRAWDNLLQNKVAFTTREDYGRHEREAQWARDRGQQSIHGPETLEPFGEGNSSSWETSGIADQARKRAEIPRLRDQLHTLKARIESAAKLKGLDIDNMQHNYTV